MTKKEKSRYEDTDKLREYLHRLKLRKFRLDCGHHVTFGRYLGNDVTVCNAVGSFRIICRDCS